VTLRRCARWARQFWPVQSCFVCGRKFWAGLPYPSWNQITRGQFWQWLPGWGEFCSRKCSDEELTRCFGSRVEKLAKNGR
jgi:hypothetical protein